MGLSRGGTIVHVYSSFLTGESAEGLVSASMLDWAMVRLPRTQSASRLRV